MLLKSSYKILAIAAGLLVAQQSHSATLSGRVVTTEQTALAGAIVTLWNEAKNQKLSTYTDAQGRYQLETDFTGKVTLRGRSPYYRDTNLDLELTDTTVLKQHLLLEKLTDEKEISDSLPASAHVAKLEFDGEGRSAFITQCNYCHQQGNMLTRNPRTEEAWSDTVRRMEGYFALLTYEEHNQVVKALHEGFDGSPIKVKQTQDYSPELAQATVHEWHVAGPLSFVHDAVVGQNGNLYGLDEGTDIVWELDRETDEITPHKIPGGEGKDRGGRFSGFQLPIGIFSGYHGPHSAAQIEDGRMYVTNALSGTIGEFNPETAEWIVHDIPEGFLWRKGLYPHTIRADKDNNVWFTVLASNMVLKMDTTTGEFTEVDLPSNGALRWATDVFAGLTFKIGELFPEANSALFLSHHKWLNQGRDIYNWPYGIDINPVDGGIWYGKLLANKIGHIDPDTLEVTEYDTPFKGPRRLRFGKDGILWIPSFDEGMLMAFDTKTKTYENIALPVMSENEYEVPYALNVHEHTGDVWIAANNSDRVLRYIPSEKRFISYPMPSRVVWFRDFEFTKDGQVCTSNSNLPAYAHEDGVPAFFCIDPEGVGKLHNDGHFAAN
ncbi:hypothetical protein DV711_03475 [Motiliproteus coralliicola]|uniref:Lyase n=1 Tax=Motiliproteus coralliicola TaxID=2283196 RepID=A0A369WSK0_9GAMM|nr:carboxypeptidase regulatory-like domain-containing protein [Motiliproteus coralliicola]RDE24662.1 hypothetical protein DV711_03475 [Motiliproteus coralliicola]